MHDDGERFTAWELISISVSDQALKIPVVEGHERIGDFVGAGRGEVGLIDVVKVEVDVFEFYLSLEFMGVEFRFGAFAVPETTC